MREPGSGKAPRGRGISPARKLLVLRAGCLLVLSASLVLRPAQAAAEERLGQLTRMLEHSDFRVRTQAAFSLGRVGDRAAVTPLVESLRDSHPAVRAAAAAALGRIGDPRALGPLRSHTDASEAVSSQVRRAITAIEERQGARSEPAPLTFERARHYVELADLANVSKTSRPGLMELLKTLSLREMRRIPAAVVAEGGARPADLDAELRRHKVSGYRVSVSLGRLVRYMAPETVQVRAEVMLAVTSYPGHSYCMTVTGTEAVSQSRRSYRDAQLPDLQEEALSGALQHGMKRLGSALTSGEALRCHGKEGARASRGGRR